VEGGTPGKTTLVQQLVQQDGARTAPGLGAGTPSAAAPAHVHVAAERGVSGTPQTLPHLDAIQRSFGGHDVSGIRAFVSGAAAGASHEMGARAYATGDAVAFAQSPDLHTAAHEAAHVVQQRAGVQLKGGVGQQGDTYEQHADAVADLVVQGKSAETTLDQLAPRSAAAAGPSATQHKAVQRAAVTTHYGEFKDAYFSEVKKDGTMIGVDLFLTFTPNAEVDAAKIGLSQSVKNYVAGKPIAVDATKQNQQVKSGPGEGYYIDRVSENRNPIYPTGDEPATNKDKMEAYGTPAPVRELSKAEKDANTAAKVTGIKYDGWGENGYRKKEGADWKVKAAELHDTPTLPTNKADSGKLFETAALAIDGTQKGTYYGSVTWGLKTDAAGNLSKVELAKGSDAVPTQNFMAAAKQWNATTARGTLVTAAADTKVYDASLSEKFKLAKDVKLDQQSKVMANDVVYLFIKVDAGAAGHAGETGYVKLSDVKDKGDGKSTLKLPYVDVKLITAAVKLYKAADKKDLIVELAKDTRLRVLKTEGDMQQIEVVHGPQTTKTGWIAKGQTKDEA
jgi:hypothetical protein